MHSLSVPYLLLVLLGCVCGAAALALEMPVSSLPPEIPEQFTSIAIVSSEGWPANNATLYYDATVKKFRTDSSFTEPLSGYIFNVSQYLGPDYAYFVSNDRCENPVAGNMNFSDLFSWVKYAKNAGDSKDSIGRKCDRWYLDTHSTNLSICVVENTPLQLDIFLPAYPFHEQFIFLTFNATAPSASSVTPPSSCFEPPPVCPGPGESEQLMGYIFHPNNTVGIIENQNVADALGDAGFICFDVLNNRTAYDHYQWVSLYDLQVYNKWGQYQLCNGYPGICTGMNDIAVGREASFGVKEDCGQCTDNSDVGSWFSLPAYGECATPDQPFDMAHNCTWRINKRIKTIDSKCLFEQLGMLDSCMAEKHYPLPKTTVILENAFKYDDVAQGGCPPIVPSAFQGRTDKYSPPRTTSHVPKLL